MSRCHAAPSGPPRRRQPSFHNANSKARLAEIFTSLRKQRIDMRPVTILEPHFTTKPFVDKNNLLRLVGFFDTRLRRINFDMAFGLAGGQRQLFGIAVIPAKPAKTLAPIKN